MITIDQILTLQEKVESAVQKIEQLTAENAALRSKCAELTNALSAKTEQFSSYEADQNKIETGLLKALERLNAVENAVLNAASEVAKESVQAQPAAQFTAQPAQTELPGTANTQASIQQVHFQEEASFQAAPSPTVHPESFPQIPQENENSMNDSIADSFENSSSVQDPSQGQFDIF